jgi:hypothetical protein
MITAALALACGGKSGLSSATSDPCGALFDAENGGACGPVLPAAELARQRARFETICSDYLALPGSGITASALVACASALETTGACETDPRAPAECQFRGTLPGGAACSDPLQCASGSCVGGNNGACGACATPLPAVTEGETGASCGSDTTPCTRGLTCDASSHCAPLGRGGATCGTDADCAIGFSCSHAKRLCLPLATLGETCATNGQTCIPSLVCASASHTCVAPAFVAAGQPCGDTSACLQGSCGYPSMTCPTVVADGQACVQNATAECDTFAGCVNGVCTSAGPAVCH